MGIETEDTGDGTPVGTHIEMIFGLKAIALALPCLRLDLAPTQNRPSKCGHTLGTRTPLLPFFESVSRH